jgi:hypothetical protein
LALDNRLQQLTVFWIPLVFIVVLAITTKFFFNYIRAGKKFFDSRLQLLYLNIGFTTIIPCLFDLTKHFYIARHHRYCLSAFPAAVILVALAISHCQRKTRFFIMLAAICIYVPFAFYFLQCDYKLPGENYRTLGQILIGARKSDAILVDYCFPVNLIAIAHYLSVEKELIGRSAYEPLDNQEEDIKIILKDKEGVYLVKVGPSDLKIHFYEKWLQQHAIKVKEWNFSKTDFCKYFVPLKDRVFF